MVRVPSTHTSNRVVVLGDIPPILARGTSWQEECAAGAADGIVLPHWWEGETCAANSGEDVGGEDGQSARANACA
jgi:hypothetical protein